MELKLGTRKSMLAWAQSGWVAREIERLNPGVRVRLEGIETKGDRILDRPLNAIDGKEFFVAEIDEVVHDLRGPSVLEPAHGVLVMQRRHLQGLSNTVHGIPHRGAQGSDAWRTFQPDPCIQRLEPAGCRHERIIRAVQLALRRPDERKHL